MRQLHRECVHKLTKIADIVANGGIDAKGDIEAIAEAAEQKKREISSSSFKQVRRPSFMAGGDCYRKMSNHDIARNLSLYAASGAGHVQGKPTGNFFLHACWEASQLAHVRVDDDGAQIFLQRSPVKKMTRCVSLRVPA